MADKSKFWCQSCAAYGEEACRTTTHRSEQMKLVDRHWESYSPSRVFERKPDGSLQRVMLDRRQRAAAEGHVTRKKRAEERRQHGQRVIEMREKRLADQRARPPEPQPTEYERLLELLRDSGGYGADSERMTYAALQARSEPERQRQQLFDGLEYLLRSLEHPTAALPRFVLLDHATLTDAEEAIKRCHARGYEACIDISSKAGGEDSSRIVISGRSVRSAS